MDGTWLRADGMRMPAHLHPDVLALTAPRKPTQDLVATRFVERQAGRLRWCRETRTWFAWDGAVWRRDRSGLVMQRLRETARELATNASGETFPAAGRTGFLTGVERLARGDPAMAAPPWPDPPLTLGTPAGPIDLATGEAAAAAPETGLRLATGVAPAPQPDCPLWRRFLDEACGEAAVVAYVQRFLGLALTGLRGAQTVLYVRGGSGTGKTVFLNTILAVMGEYAGPVPAGLATGGPDRADELAALEGLRLVTTGSVSRGAGWLSRRLARFVGGDAVALAGGRRVTLNCKMIAAGHRAPSIEALEPGLLRHLRIVTFRKPATVDPDLERKLVAEAPGILRWMIEGCRAWQGSGLGTPAATEEATFDYLLEESVVGLFLVETCAGKPDDDKRRVSAGALHRAWVAFAERNGEPAGSRRAFAEAVVTHGFRRDRDMHERFYLGLSLPHDA